MLWFNFNNPSLSSSNIKCSTLLSCVCVSNHRKQNKVSKQIKEKKSHRSDRASEESTTRVLRGVWCKHRAPTRPTRTLLVRLHLLLSSDSTNVPACFPSCRAFSGPVPHLPTLIAAALAPDRRITTVSALVLSITLLPLSAMASLKSRGVGAFILLRKRDPLALRFGWENRQGVQLRLINRSEEVEVGFHGGRRLHLSLTPSFWNLGRGCHVARDLPLSPPPVRLAAAD